MFNDIHCWACSGLMNYFSMERWFVQVVVFVCCVYAASICIFTRCTAQPLLGFNKGYGVDVNQLVGEVHHWPSWTPWVRQGWHQGWWAHGRVGMCVYQFGSLQILRCSTENDVLRYFPIVFGCKHLKPLASYLLRFSNFEAYLRIWFNLVSERS